MEVFFSSGSNQDIPFQFRHRYVRLPSRRVITIDFETVIAFVSVVHPSVAGLDPVVEPGTVEVASLATAFSVFHTHLGVPRIETCLLLLCRQIASPEADLDGWDRVIVVLFLFDRRC